MNKRHSIAELILRGLGGAAVAAPFLPSIVEREAKAQGMTATDSQAADRVLHPLRVSDQPVVPGEVARPPVDRRLHGDPDPRAAGALREQAAHASGYPGHERVELRRDARAKERSPHEPVRIDVHGSPLDPQRSEQRGACNIGKFDAKPTGRSLDHIAAAAVNPNERGRSALHADRRRQRQRHATPVRHLVVGRRRHHLPGCTGSPTHGLQQPHEPVRHGHHDPNPDTYKVARGKSVIDCVRDDLNRLSSINMSASDKQKLTRVDRAAPLRGRHGHARGRPVQHGHGDEPRPDRDLDRQRHHEDREHHHGSRGADVALRQPTA